MHMYIHVQAHTQSFSLIHKCTNNPPPPLLSVYFIFEKAQAYSMMFLFSISLSHTHTYLLTAGMVLNYKE